MAKTQSPKDRSFKITEFFPDHRLDGAGEELFAETKGPKDDPLHFSKCPRLFQLCQKAVDRVRRFLRIFQEKDRPIRLELKWGPQEGGDQGQASPNEPASRVSWSDNRSGLQFLPLER